VHSEFELLDRVAWSAPTIVGDKMYVRDKVQIMALDLSASQTAAAAQMASAEAAEAADEEAAAPAEVAEVAEEATEDSEAIEILRKVDAAAKAVGAVSYKVSSVPAGIAVNFLSASEGGGVMTGWTGQRPEKFRMSVKTTRPGTGEAMAVTGGGDGEMFFLLDHLDKKAYEDFDPAVMGAGGNALGAVSMLEFVHPTPFSDEINADVAELQGTEDVGGVECHRIDVVYSGGRGKSTWFVSTEDFLPRRRIRHFTTPQGEGTLDVVVTDLVVDPDIGPDTFAMKLPEGYEQVDDFAP
jgi:hypothetical protein